MEFIIVIYGGLLFVAGISIWNQLVNIAVELNNISNILRAIYNKGEKR